MEPYGQDPKLKAVVAAAHELGLVIEPQTSPEGTRTAADAARAVGCDVAQIVKSLVFVSDDSPLLFLVSGANRLDPERAARVAGVDRLDKADAGTVKKATGYSIGATPPFGHAQRLAVFMDEDLLAHERVWAAAGRTDAVFAVDPKRLQDATGAVVAKLGADE
jgi:prolyl-tRNA editing enzyme YbaK/EbsC (Cys-tRNA(Pro) deacylase)